jgi:solute carrier family 35 protein F1/2
MGLVLLVVADYLLAEEAAQSDPLSVLFGDVLVLCGASLYATSNVSQEYAVNAYSRTEFLAYLGFFGTMISGVQMALLEHDRLAAVTWSWRVVVDILGFSACLLSMYVLTPSMIKMSSAVVLNLSLLTSDFYAVIVAVFLFGQTFSFLYLIAFGVTVSGLIVYHLPYEYPWPAWMCGDGEEGEREKFEEEEERCALGEEKMDEVV